jgi:microcystin degradation protein MlrC
MARILIFSCQQEVSSFNPVPSTIEDFTIDRGQPWLDHQRSINDEIGGALSVFEADERIELVPAMGVGAITSGGTLRDFDWQELSSELLQSIRDNAQVDAAYFCLHGAMSAEGESDPEGFLLQEARQILGPDVPLVVSLDLHGILTDRMIASSDAIVVYHTYPHIDMGSTGKRAARLLLRILRGEVKPVTARVKIPALVRGDELITASGLFGKCIDLCRQIESSDQGLAAGMMIGNPFTDVPELRTNSLVITDGDAQKAGEFARQLAELFWQHHEQMQVPLVPLAEAVRQAGKATGTVIMTDAADATSSGASGDSNAIAAALLSAGYTGTILTPVVDAPAVQASQAAGIGGTVSITLGGNQDPGRFTPLPVEGTVRMLSDGDFRSETFGYHWRAGPSAVIEAGHVTWMVTSRPVSLFDRSLFYAHGLDPKRFDAVVVKSPHCEPHMFADWCGLLLNVDTPGATSANLQSLGHTRAPRPIFPLDEQVQLEPAVEIYGND